MFTQPGLVHLQLSSGAQADNVALALKLGQLPWPQGGSEWP